MDRPIVIQCAMKVEINFLIDMLSDVKELKYGEFVLYEGFIDNYFIVICISGVGTINSASSFMYLINKYNPLCIINYGIVGSASKDIHKCDLVVGGSVLNVNSYKSSYRKNGMGCSYSDYEYITFKEGIDELVYWKGNSKLIEFSYNVKDYYTYGEVFYGVIGSGDSWNNEVDKINYLNSKYGVSCFDMECISIYMLGCKFDIPCISFKVVSDNILNNEEYDRNVGVKIKNYLYNYIKIVIKNNVLLK